VQVKERTKALKAKQAAAKAKQTGAAAAGSKQVSDYPPLSM
jgi:hypothetical protein